MFNFLKKKMENQDSLVDTKPMTGEELAEKSPWVEEKSTEVRNLMTDVDNNKCFIALIGEKFEDASSDKTSVAAAIICEGNIFTSAHLMANLFKAHPELLALTQAMMKL